MLYSISFLATVIVLATVDKATATGKVDCSAVLCLRPSCPNPVVPPGECCGVCETDCRTVRCAQPLCANPVKPPGRCCPSCENSGCKFEGCVNFQPDGSVTWAPSPCFQCQCFENETICAIIDCFGLTEDDCFGRPVITRPWECCPSCDFGTRSDTCTVVPVPKTAGGVRNITVSDGYTSCSKKVFQHTCNVRGFRKNGKTFVCRPRERKRHVKFGKECPLCTGFYRDVQRCVAVQDESEIIGCDILLE